MEERVVRIARNVIEHLALERQPDAHGRGGGRLSNAAGRIHEVGA